MSEAISIEQLDNGLTLIVEPIDDVESVAYELLLPGGIVLDPEGQEGESLVLGELTARGAGPHDSRALLDTFDAHGIRHGEGGGHDRFSYRGSCLPAHLEKALELVSLMVREPHLPDVDVPNIQSVMAQDLQALEDNPSRKVMHILSANFFPNPYNRSPLGTEAGIAGCTVENQRAAWARRFGAKGAVLSVAGRCVRDGVRAAVERFFASWRGAAEALPAYGTFPEATRVHHQVESAQLQIALGFACAKFGDPDYYAAKVAVGVLSGGMFGRLFTEVREKRGLVYSVYARHAATKDYGWISAYAGTTPERAQETATVMFEQFRSLSGTVSEEELKRVKANLKAAIVISDESPSSRSSSNAQDFWVGRRVRSLEEILSSLERVTAADVDRVCARFPADKALVVTLGSKELA